MVVRSKYLQVPVNEYIAFDGTVFDNEAACLEYERKGANHNPSIRFFSGIAELVPSETFPLEKVVKLATAFVIIDPQRAKGFLNSLRENYDIRYSPAELTVGTVFVYDQILKSYTILENRILALVRLYNGLMTVCEPCLGAGAMEIGVDWRARK